MQIKFCLFSSVIKVSKQKRSLLFESSSYIVHACTVQLNFNEYLINHTLVSWVSCTSIVIRTFSFKTRFAPSFINLSQIYMGFTSKIHLMRKLYCEKSSDTRRAAAFARDHLMRRERNRIVPADG